MKAKELAQRVAAGEHVFAVGPVHDTLITVHVLRVERNTAIVRTRTGEARRPVGTLLPVAEAQAIIDKRQAERDRREAEAWPEGWDQ